jgi:hypothetical protein
MTGQNGSSFWSKLFFLSILVPSPTLASDQTIFPAGGGAPIPPQFLSPVPATSVAGTDVRMKIGCFGTNLRYVNNPLSPNSTVKMHLNWPCLPELYVSFPAAVAQPKFVERAVYTSLTANYTKSSLPLTNFFTHADSFHNYKQKKHTCSIDSNYVTTCKGIGVHANVVHNCFFLGFTKGDHGNILIGCDHVSAAPTTITNGSNSDYAIVDASGSPVPPGTASLQAYGNTVKVNFPGVATIPQNAPGSPYGISTKLDSAISFSQVAPTSGGEFLAKTGALPYRGSVQVSGNEILVQPNFPGQEGYCGGYHSPLMLFFDENLPKFTGISSFPLDPKSEFISWPEPGAPGYFLALDDGSGKITKASQLFGDDSAHENGFEALKDYDSNHDGIIDEKDPVFSKLLLWKDENGDGLSTPNELHHLSEFGVFAIDLNYQKDRDFSLGTGQAKIHGTSAFGFHKKGVSEIQKGRVLDIWFVPISHQN